jgi:hypothetical protein
MSTEDRLSRLEVVATKADIAAVRADVREMELRLGKAISDSHVARLKWMVGQTFVILGVVEALHLVKSVA